jgi:hypothetical protein
LVIPLNLRGISLGFVIPPNLGGISFAVRVASLKLVLLALRLTERGARPVSFPTTLAVLALLSPSDFPSNLGEVLPFFRGPGVVLSLFLSLRISINRV